MKYRNIPNILSGIRILMVPLFIYVFFLDYPRNIIPALCIFLLAGITDIADGYLARRNNWITNLGKLLDPLADKLMQSCVLICLAAKHIIPWQLTAIFLLKELFMVFGALLVLKKIKVTVKSHWYGKVTTSIIYATIIIVFFGQEFNLQFPFSLNFLFLIPLASTLFSLVMYIFDTVNINRQIKKEKNDI